MTDPAFSAAVDGLLDVMRDRDLPVPTTIRWDTYPRPHLEVSVHARHFRPWCEAVQYVHVASEDTDKYRHTHLYGWLATETRRHRILLTTIVPLDDHADARPA